MSDLHKRLADMRGRSEAATPGPWLWHGYMNTGQTLAMPNPGYHEANILKTTDDWPPTDADAEFIAHARTDLDDLRGAVEDVLRICDTADANPGPDGTRKAHTVMLRAAITARLGRAR